MEADPSVYSILGHGNETMIHFDSRRKVPEGTVLVLGSAFGTNVLSPLYFQFMEYFRKKGSYKLLKDPLRARHILEKRFPTIRIYLPGDSMPQVSTSLNASFEDHLAKAGIYKYPSIPKIDHRRFPMYLNSISQNGASWGNDDLSSLPYIMEKGKEYTEEIHKEIYRGSLFVPKYDGNIPNKSYSLSQILQKFGPGVYYFMGCRGLARLDVSTVLDHIKNDVIQSQRGYSKYILKTARKNMENFENMENAFLSRSFETSMTPRIHRIQNRILMSTHNKIGLSHSRDVIELTEFYKKVLNEVDLETVETASRAQRTMQQLTQNIQPLLDMSSEQQRKNRKQSKE